MIVAFYGRSLLIMMVILGLTSWVGYALFIRAEFLRLRTSDYVDDRTVMVNADAAAGEFKATPLDGYRSVVFRDDIDAVLMLSPQWYGLLPLLAACDAGKAVYCAAPFSLAAAENCKLQQRVEQSGIAFVSEFVRRFAPATVRLKELIATRLGKPRLLFCHQRMSTEPPAKVENDECRLPFVDRELLEMVDWCRFLVGSEPTSTVAVYHKPDYARQDGDYHMLSLDFSAPGDVGAGAIAQVSAGNYIPPQWSEAVSFRRPNQLQICCENGVAFADLPTTLVWFDDAGRHIETLDGERPVGETLLHHFYRSVTSLVRQSSGLSDTMQALRILQAAERSVQEGRRVKIE